MRMTPDPQNPPTRKQETAMTAAEDTQATPSRKYSLDALAQEATVNAAATLERETRTNVANGSMHLNNILDALPGKKGLAFAKIFAELFSRAEDSGDPETFLADLLNGSTPVDRGSVAHDLRDELTLLNSKRADEDHEVGAAIRIIKEMVNATFGPEATTVGTPQPWRVIHHPVYGSVPAIFAALQESNRLLATALTNADALVPVVTELRDMKFDANTQSPYIHDEPLVHHNDRNDATAILTDYQEAAEAARRAIPTTSRQQGTLGSGSN
jgi:hypothetical protein